jgi:hypothetical protein
MVRTDSIVSGGLQYEAAWIYCKAAASFKPYEALVRIQPSDLLEPLPFFVDRELVEPADLPTGEEIDGRVKCILLEQADGFAVVEVPGEPLSFGPKIRVSKQLMS